MYALCSSSPDRTEAQRDVLNLDVDVRAISVCGSRKDSHTQIGHLLARTRVLDRFSRRRRQGDLVKWERFEHADIDRRFAQW